MVAAQSWLLSEGWSRAGPIHLDEVRSDDSRHGRPATFGCWGVTELVEWNEPSTWKFAWPSTILEYLCFAETAWGDQYAYRY